MGREKGSLDFGTVRIAEKERGTDNTNYPRDDLQRGRENGEGKAKNEQIYGTPGLAELSRFLEQWRTEWANKNFSGLMDLYDPAYRVGPVDFETLKRRKRAALNQYERIDVQLQDILIKREDGKVRIDFLQFFQGDDYSDKGAKTLYVTRDPKGRLRITAEYWKPLGIPASDRGFTEPKPGTAQRKMQSKQPKQQDSVIPGKSTRDERVGVQNQRHESVATISEECASSVHNSKNCPELRLALVKLLRKLRPLKRKVLRSLDLSEAEKNLLIESEFQENCISQHLNARCSSASSR